MTTLLLLLTIALGIAANQCIEQLLECKFAHRRYLPPQRLTTTRYRQLSLRLRQLEALKLNQVELARWPLYAI